MFSKVSENKMRLVRQILAIGWMILIISMFYDPLTMQFTDVNNFNSPFRINNDKQIIVQGEKIDQVSYHLSARIFWTMIIPLTPILIMLVGHEGWRRICPLSFFSQIPRYINKNYYLKNINRKTGKIETKLNLVLKNSWLQKNHLYLQFALLFIGLCVRILFVNSDRIALAIFLIFIITSAITIGYLYGGKTWCNYICPVGIVQKIYSEPGGLLESKAHIKKSQISQSMCRESTPSGDKSICVGCTSNCPDIDLESSYWRTIEDPSRKFIYYGFLGLVIGFYGYYYLYSGNWDYYFSGIWTHEIDQINNIFRPGLYLYGHTINILPKLLAVPLVLGISVSISYLFGILIENAYRIVRVKINKPLHEKDLLNQVFSVYAFMTINIFYIFGGRPNVRLMGEETQEIIGYIILIITSLWLDKVLSRSYKGYQRESIADRLLEQIKKLKINFDEILDGNSLDKLNYDEIYILGKTLPGITQKEKLNVYKNILCDSLQNGSCTTSDSLALLSDIRTGMRITEEEHNTILKELGIENSELFDSNKVLSQEIILREYNYREHLSYLIEEAHDKNINISDYLSKQNLKISKLKSMYSIDEHKHSLIVAELIGDNSQYINKADNVIDNLILITMQLYTLMHNKCSNDNLDSYLEIIIKLISVDRQRHVNYLIDLIKILGDSQEAKIIACNVRVLVGEGIDINSSENLNNNLNSDVYNILTGEMTIELDDLLTKYNTEISVALKKQSYSNIVLNSPDLEEVLSVLIEQEDIMISAYSLLALYLIDQQKAKQKAKFLKHKFEIKHWLILEVIEYILEEKNVRVEMVKESINVTICSMDENSKTVSFSKPIVSFGKDYSNDIILKGVNIRQYQGCIKKLHNNEVYLDFLEKPEYIYINDKLIDNLIIKLNLEDKIRFGDCETITVNWDDEIEQFSLLTFPTFEKIIWMSNTKLFNSLDLFSLADIVRNAEVRSYLMDSYICEQGKFSKGAYIIYNGTAEVIYTIGEVSEIINILHKNDVIGELSIIRGTSHSASVKVTSNKLTVLVIEKDTLTKAIDNNHSLAKKLLIRVASYVK